MLAGKERRRVAAVVAAERALSVMAAERDELLEALKFYATEWFRKPIQELSHGKIVQSVPSADLAADKGELARTLLSKHRGAAPEIDGETEAAWNEGLIVSRSGAEKKED